MNYFRRTIVDAVLAPFVYVAARLLRHVRRRGIQKFPKSRAALLAAGVFPVRNHYYEPRFDFRDLDRPLYAERPLPGIDWRLGAQIAALASLDGGDVIERLKEPLRGGRRFSFDNGSFGPGDAEIWFRMLRTLKPKRVIEVGSGASTLIALNALEQNRAEDSAATCEHVCIEPFESPWLEQTGVTVVRDLVERLPVSFFQELGPNDVLFIDSSHMIRPQGDVLFEYLELLPCLATGVVVHVHDIFSPRDYLPHWLTDEVKFWNEQYLLEAFLSHNRDWEIMVALNQLKHSAYDDLAAVAPMLEPDIEPGSIYIRRVS